MCKSDLVLRAQAGDREAFGELVSRYRGMVYGLCFGMVKQASDAEDLAHEAFVEAFLKLHQLREPEKLESWLKTLVLNLCRMWFRQQKRDRDGLLHYLSVGEGKEPESAFDEMSGGLSRLSASHRLALVLYYWEGLSYEEMAAFLDVPVGTVMSRLHRARSALKEGMEEMVKDRDIPTGDEDAFRQEVDAEIRLLLEMSGEDARPMERLSVILTRSPEHFAELIRQVEDETVLDHLVSVMRRVRRPAMEVALACYFSTDAELHSRANRLLNRWAAGCRQGASLEAYAFLDLVIQSPVEVGSKAALLVDLLEAGRDVGTQKLLTNVVLCYPDAAFPLLMKRFMDAPSSEGSSALYALVRTGTRFCDALLEPLAGRNTHQQRLALAGIEIVARSFDPPRFTDAPPEEWREQVRLRDQALQGRSRFAHPISLLLKAPLDPVVLQATAERVAAIVDHPQADLRDTAICILGLMKADVYADQIRACLTHNDLSTRLTAIRAHTGMADEEGAALLTATAREGEAAERRVAVEVLGRLGISDAQPLCVDLLDDPDQEVRQAAVTALGELGDEDARTMLEDLMGSKDKTLARAAANALYGGRKWKQMPSETTQARLKKVRGDAHPKFQMSPLEAIRTLPEIRPYDERELTRLIAQVCDDYSTTRRHLVMYGRDRLMNRANGIYTLTEMGEAVWRVEHFIEAHYLEM